MIASKKNGFSKQKSNEEEFEGVKFNKEDLQEFAKVGGEILRKTFSSGFDAFKEVKGSFPRETGQIFSKAKEDFIKNLTNEISK
ncbi:MAG: hypothetical protein K2X39_02815, partial [Silvanigrellaceae bacterium]|nr:hypothetical protein [Silvanigrellaceae bacterium]